MAIAEVKIAKEGIMQEALQNDILVARRSRVVDTTKAVGTTWRCDGIGRYVPRVFLARVGEELIMFPLATYKESC
jgi:hypothetical protein